MLGRFKHLSSVEHIEYTNQLELEFRDADVFVFPTHEEGSALVTYEALAAGLPTITTKNSGTVGQQDVNTIFVPCDDETALIEALGFLKDHPDQKMKMAKAARAQAENYTWESAGQRLVETYQTILD